MKRRGSLLILLVLVAGLAGPADARLPPGSGGLLPAATQAGSAAQPLGGSVDLQTIVWDKTIDGIDWYSGMTITRQTSDTIVVQDVWHLAPPLAGATPFVPVQTSGPSPEWVTNRPAVSSPPGPPGRPEAPANPEAVLWDQPLSTVNQVAYVDQDFPDLPAYSSFLADDFSNAEIWHISSIFVPGDGLGGFGSLVDFDSLTWQIYADCAGAPRPCSCGAPLRTKTWSACDKGVRSRANQPAAVMPRMTERVTKPTLRLILKTVRWLIRGKKERFSCPTRSVLAVQRSRWRAGPRA
jgi:hypothetical protein